MEKEGIYIPEGYNLREIWSWLNAKTIIGGLGIRVGNFIDKYRQFSGHIAGISADEYDDIYNSDRSIEFLENSKNLSVDSQASVIWNGLLGEDPTNRTRENLKAVIKAAIEQKQVEGSEVPPALERALRIIKIIEQYNCGNIYRLTLECRNKIAESIPPDEELQVPTLELQTKMVIIGRELKPLFEPYKTSPVHDLGGVMQHIVDQVPMAGFVKSIAETLQALPAREVPRSPYITAGEYVRFTNQVLGYAAVP